MLWTSALIAAVLLQPADGSYESDAAAPSSSFNPQWFAVPGDGTNRWGFENFWPRVGVQHRSQGYGYDSGYTSFDAFVPLYQEDFTRLTGFQGSFLIDNYSDVGFNAGLLQREYVDSLDRIFGANTFYTHRSQGGNDFHQIGFGIETLGSYVDWRANGYLPLGDEFQIPKSGGGVTDAVFSRRSILVNFIADKPLAGFDTEIGGILPGSLDMFRAYAGFYGFTGDYSEDVWGYQGRVEARLQDAGVASVSLTNDGTFGTNVVFAIAFWLPGSGPRNTPPSGRAAGRLAEDVIRNQNIVIDRSPTTEPVPARWLSGTEIDVVHVSSNGLLPGLGTPNLPVQTLQAAQLLGGRESLVFVHANTVYNGEDIRLQDGQYLLGEGVEHTIHSLYGSFVLPTVTPPEDIVNVPSIIGAPGDGVTVADRTVVAGLQILGSGQNGVVGTGVTDVTLDRLNIDGSADSGIRLLSAAGDIRVTENFLNNNGRTGLRITTSGDERSNNLVVSDNTVLGNAWEGIGITTNGQSSNTLVMERNLVRVILGPRDDRGLPLVEINARDSSRLSARVDDNDIEDAFLRDDTSPDEDPYYHQFVLNAENNSRVDIGFFENRLSSNRRFLADNPRNGSFGFDLNSFDLSVLRARLESNTSSLNYAFAENYISRFELEDTLGTNTGLLLYFPTENFIGTIPDGSIPLPQ